MTKFYLKDKTKFQQQNKIVYHSKYLHETCTKDYVVVNINERIEKRTIDHNKRDKNLHILNQSGDMNHQHVKKNDFRVLGNNYRSMFKRKMSEC